MNLSRSASVWIRIVASFALGFLAGIITEYNVRPGSTVGVFAALTVGAAIFASLIAALLPERFSRERDRHSFLREHADLIRTQVYVPLVSSGTIIAGQLLSESESVVGQRGGAGPDWAYPAASGPLPVSEFANWQLGKEHIESDSALSAAFKLAWGRLTQRVGRKSELDSLYLRKVTELVEMVFGSGFPAASSLAVPEPARWFNVAVVVNWIRNGRSGFVFSEQDTGSQYRILGGGMILLTSDRPLIAPATDFSKVLSGCAADPGLQSSWAEWIREDAEDQAALGRFVRAIKLAGERIQATHHIPGRCEVCST